MTSPEPDLPTLETERLRLRRLERRDVPALFRVFSDPEVTRYTSRTPMRALDEAETFLAEIHARTSTGDYTHWGVALRESDEVIGSCILMGIDHTHLRAELGYALARHAWGHGYMREAIGCVLDYCFGPLALARIEALVDPRNERSLRVLTRFGFVREGLVREHMRVGEEVRSSVLLGLLAREWAGSE